MSRLGREESLDARPGPPRRRFRLRFREFLLLVTLASMIAAAFALRFKVVRDEDALDHLFNHAHRARASAEWWGKQVAEATKRLDERPKIAEEWLAGCAVKLLPTKRNPKSFAATGKTLAVALDPDASSIWIGAFDEKGKLFLEHFDDSREMHALLGRLAWPLTTIELTGGAKRATVDLVAAIFARYEHDLQEGLKTTRAQLAHEIAEAERHEQQAGVR
jgi:hypothetical protein